MTDVSKLLEAEVFKRPIAMTDSCLLASKQRQRSSKVCLMNKTGILWQTTCS
jgi:hypothetical protein